MMKVGVIVDCFQKGLYEGIKLAAQCGAEAVQFTSRTPEIHPDNITPAVIKEIKDMVSSLGMEISSYCSSLRFGFSEEGIANGNIELTKKMMDISQEFGVNVMNAHAGQLKTPSVRRAVTEIGKYCESVGGYFALETGPETPEFLKEFIETIDTNAIRVNFDPANLVMIQGVDAAEAATTVGKYIMHTHAKDGILVSKPEGRTWYDLADDEKGPVADYFLEVPLGEGHVNFPKYIGALKAIGYDGFLTIEREAGDTRYEDIKNGIAFLKSLR